MRRDRPRLVIAATAALTILGWSATSHGQAAGDSASAVMAAPGPPAVWAPPDSAASAARADSLAATSYAAIEPDRWALELLDVRRDGATTVRLQWRGRWPVGIVALPLAGDGFDRPVVLDAGVAVRAWSPPSTDRTTVGGYLLSFGVPNAAATIAVPPPPDGDPFLVDAWGRAESARPAIGGPAELLAAPAPTLWWRRPLLDPRAATEPTSSALLYEKGERGVERTGIRFAAPGFARGLAGAYTRRVGDGDEAFFRVLETRYVVAANLLRGGATDAWIEGTVADRRIQSAVDDPGLGYRQDGEAAGERRRLALHARRRAGRGEIAIEADLARVKHTQIDPLDGARERWDEPSVSLAATARRSLASGWTGLLSLEGSAGTIRSRAGPAVVSGGVLDASREIRRRDVRAAVAVRRGLPRDGTVAGADLAWDVRESDRSAIDARISVATRGARVSTALDLESSHQRASWEDRFVPTRDRGFANVLVLPQAVRYRTESDPSLRPRRLSGLSGRAVWTPRGRVTLHATGSYRYVTDDFGWDVARTETPDSIDIVERAGRRGSGWSRHLSLGAAWRAGFLETRVQGWIRGGSAGSGALGPSPRAGSLPRAGLDASVNLRAVLFEGDLPLRLGLDAHVAGERDGLIRAPALTTLDGSLRADFTDAGLYLRFEDLLDRRPPGGVYDLATGEGVPQMGRRFRFGVIWHLLD